jgi:RNA-binding protein 8A
LFLAIEGYVIFVGNLHEEIQEDQVKELFLNYGIVKNISMNINRRNGYMKVLCRYNFIKIV